MVGPIYDLLIFSLCTRYIIWIVTNTALILLLQASELRAYIKSKGADISEENSEGGLHVDLAQIIEACDVCLKDDDKGLIHKS